VAVRDTAMEAGSSWSSGGGATAGGCRGTDDRVTGSVVGMGTTSPRICPEFARVLVLDEALHPVESRTERAETQVLDPIVCTGARVRPVRTKIFSFTADQARRSPVGHGGDLHLRAQSQALLPAPACDRVARGSVEGLRRWVMMARRAGARKGDQWYRSGDDGLRLFP
jgi:hypothetical protein